MTGLPPQRNVDANDVTYEGYVAPADAPPTNAEYYQFVTRAYFSTMRIPIVSGRGFGPSDDGRSQPVAVINETLARHYYENQNPIGRRVQQTGSKTFFTIVGVAKDVKQGGVDSRVGTELYFLYEQTPTTAFDYTPTAMNVVVRSTLDKSALAPIIQRMVKALDAALPVVAFRSMDEVVSDSVARPRFLAQLLGVFALLRCCCPRSGLTACWRSPSWSAGARSAFAWRSGRPKMAFSRWCCGRDWGSRRRGS